MATRKTETAVAVFLVIKLATTTVKPGQVQATVVAGSITMMVGVGGKVGTTTVETTQTTVVVGSPTIAVGKRSRLEQQTRAPQSWWVLSLL